MLKRLAVLILLVCAIVAFARVQLTPTQSQVAPTTAQLFNVDWNVCYLPPSPGATDCPAGGDSAPASSDVTAYEITSFPMGSRLAGSVVTYTPSTWSTSAATPSDNISIQLDYGCDGSPDIIAAGPRTADGDLGVTGFEGPGVAWNDQTHWNPYPLAAGSAPSYATSLKPTPSSFSSISYERADARTIWLGGSVPLFWPRLQGPESTSPLPYSYFLETAPAYAGSARVSSLLLRGDPEPPSNGFPCNDSPENVMVKNTRLHTPSSPGLSPRWAMFTSDADARGPNPSTPQVSGDTSVTRVLVLQCAVVGTGSWTDADGDCLASGTDANDAVADQDGDGLPDGIEAALGSKYIPGTCANPSNPASDCDLDGANDYNELFQFTDPNNADTDGDGSLDLQDSGADECTGTVTATGCTSANSLQVDDTIADDNCPSVANPDQLNTDAAPSYHGGNASWNDTNAGTTAGAPPAPTLITNYGPIVSIVTTATTATVTTTSAHNLALNQIVEILGVTGVNGGTASQNNSARVALNGVFAVQAPTGNTFTYTINQVQPAAIAGTATPLVSTPTTGIIIRPATGDVTNPDQDVWGDLCDQDDDNDGLLDVSEPRVRIVPWLGPGTTVCRDPGTIGSVFPVTIIDPLSGDSDQDMVLDGIECQMGSRPDLGGVGAGVIASCSITPIDPDGCGWPMAPATGEDPDGDLLFGSGLSGAHDTVEGFYRTMRVSQPGGGQLHDGDLDLTPGTGDKDSDADWNIDRTPGAKPSPSTSVGLQDGLEVRFYGTMPSNPDSDLDGCDDGRETGDVNGDRTVNPGDQATVTNRLTTIAGLDNGLAGDPVAGDGQLNPYGINFDLNKDRAISPGDQALDAFYVARGGGCLSIRQLGLVVTNLPNLWN